MASASPIRAASASFRRQVSEPSTTTTRKTTAQPRSGDLRRSFARPAKLRGHRRRKRHGRHVELRRHGEDRHRREGRHHLLGRRAAAQPAVVPHGGAKTKLAPIVSSARAANCCCQKWFSDYRGTSPTPSSSKVPRRAVTSDTRRSRSPTSALFARSPRSRNRRRGCAFGAEHDCHIPVIAGGGIYTGEDIYRIMQLGADLRADGHALRDTEECDADPAFEADLSLRR